MSEVVLINVSGCDRPGITARLTGILANYDIAVLGIGQSVIHDTLALGLLVELDFKESFRRRMALLEGLEERVLAGVAERLPITDGAERLITNLKRLGYKVAILSGGFTYFAEHLRRRFGVDYVYANRLEFQKRTFSWFRLPAARAAAN